SCRFESDRRGLPSTADRTPGSAGRTAPDRPGNSLPEASRVLWNLALKGSRDSFFFLKRILPLCGHNVNGLIILAFNIKGYRRGEPHPFRHSGAAAGGSCARTDAF